MKYDEIDRVLDVALLFVMQYSMNRTPKSLYRPVIFDDLGERKKIATRLIMEVNKHEAIEHHRKPDVTDNCMSTFYML